MFKNFKQFIKNEKKNNEKSIIVYLILRFIVIICMILQIIRGDLNNAFLCLLTLMLFLLPFIIEKKFSVDIPQTLQIIILIFIFSAEILGEINNFYNIIPFWDTLLHTLNGFLSAAIGLALVDLLNKNSKNFKLSPIYIVIVSFCFSMTIGVFWELFEYTADNLFKTDMQKDNYVTEISSTLLNDSIKNKTIEINEIDYTILYNLQNNELITIKNGYLDIGLKDTMEDLIVNFIGATIFCIIAYISIKSNGKFHKFIRNFTPKKFNNNNLEMR